MTSQDFPGRRRVILAGTSLLGAATLGALAFPIPLRTGKVDGSDEVAPAEDLMREHGVLKRVLLIYDEIATRLRAGKAYPPEVLAGAAVIIRDFIENYHEKLEEQHLFPRFEKAGKLVDLVADLRLQHQRGRRLTEKILTIAKNATPREPSVTAGLTQALQLFTRMYNVHEAREDTVLFPAFRTLVSKSEYDALGEEFEGKERELFGDDGFERYVENVAALERALGIYELSTFTPDP